MAVVIRDEEIDVIRDQVFREIADTLRPDRLEFDRGYALIAVVGEGLSASVGLTARVLTALADADIPLCLVSQGIAEIKLMVGVADTDHERTVQTIYRPLTQSEQPARV